MRVANVFLSTMVAASLAADQRGSSSRGADLLVVYAHLVSRYEGIHDWLADQAPKPTFGNDLVLLNRSLEGAGADLQRRMMFVGDVRRLDSSYDQVTPLSDAAASLVVTLARKGESPIAVLGSIGPARATVFSIGPQMEVRVLYDSLDSGGIRLGALAAVEISSGRLCFQERKQLGSGPNAPRGRHACLGADERLEVTP